jgi:HTH-type transcriptional regulator, quorum sensing regulator NprR
MNIGLTIKMQRKMKNMTQEELANGIISTSYLSKIENEQTTANTEIIKMLFSRLNLEYKENEHEKWSELCREWFLLLSDSENINQIQRQFSEILQILNNTSNEVLSTSIHIHLIRYFCMVSQFDKANEKINELITVSTHFTDEQKYFWNKYRGNYDHNMGNYQSAYSNYNVAIEFIPKLNLAKLEMGDFYYTFSLTCSKIRSPYEAIDYSLKALKIYKDEYHIKRSYLCNVTLGISYRRTLIIDTALEHYKTALQLAKKLNNNNHLSLVYLNLGHLYFSQEMFDSALDMYQSGLEYVKSNDENHYLLILSLVKLHIKMNNHHDAKILITKGLQLLEDENTNQGIKLELYAQLNIIQNDIEKLIKHVEEKVLPYYKKQNDPSKIVEYSSLLSHYYSSMKTYKKALKHDREIIKLYSQQVQF